MNLDNKAAEAFHRAATRISKMVLLGDFATPICKMR